MTLNINRVFPRNWYAVSYLKDLKKIPVKKRVAGKDFVLYRDENGEVQALSPYCPHRGADLSLGTVVNGTIVCPYHGWEFNGCGTCIRIPSQPNKPIPKFAHTMSYPVKEKIGLIWVYPDNEGTPPEWQTFQAMENGSFKLSSFQATWNAHFTRSIESVLDIAHLAYVHKKTIGRKTKTESTNYKLEGTLDQFLFSNGEAYLEYKFPHQWMLHSGKQENESFIQYITFTPIDEEETLIMGYAGRTFLKKFPLLDQILARFSLKVLKEDQIIVESQHPRPIPEALKMEAHVYADMAQVQFRKRWFEFLQNESCFHLIKGT
ncbi:TPA: aromatic ring-hydroxylating dioxygenase subunit alpha [Bacillus toyonensis]|nr:aromatic ring-hydroxylating dioxygenase subunit alpha [Bacillus toyonensis]HDR7343779.1 aromatic ring-hydroxylating dioxygenase subunit alpha [Bacillus toyonensis]HDR7401487.1 aromatic ring-hydroxylating dioxygenase subunit alpha [Bacillus toyonensis]HDR7504623.1 aromatic ring-hydroxylating dioxygenase subunit alpha [Bacillus toyonensis]HDR7838819.1 aromatic ring-hydroxylating dioxygenase subunit alpha [Bacillus toyonensis]